MSSSKSSSVLALAAIGARRRARALALVPVLALAAAAGCAGDDTADSAGPAIEAADAADGSLRGELAIYVASDVAGTGASELRYFLRGRDGEERRLLFDHDPGLAAGTDLKVWGAATPDGLRVLSFQVVPPRVARQVSPLVAGGPFPSRSFAFVLVDLGGGVNTDASAAMGRLIGDADSLRNYYLYASYGRQDITAQVFGPIRHQLDGCQTNQLAKALRPQIEGSFQHYLWYFGSRMPACDWAGLASLGTPDQPSRDTWYNGSTSCVVLVQEPGHNFGMQHASSLRCPGTPLSDNPSADCQANEYGDPFDPMGVGCRHMNAWQKAYQGWLGGCNGVKVTASGTFRLLPYESRCDGAQFLQVKAARPRTFTRPAGGGSGASTETLGYYYVELRTPLDFDGTLGGGPEISPRVLIHAADDLRPRSARGAHTYLLDMTPDSISGAGGFNDAALGVGRTFQDPAGGVSITVEAVSAGEATIRVDMPGGSGAPLCLDGTTFAPPGPGLESCSADRTGGPVAPLGQPGGEPLASNDGAAGGGGGCSVAPAPGATLAGVALVLGALLLRSRRRVFVLAAVVLGSRRRVLVRRARAGSRVGRRLTGATVDDDRDARGDRVRRR